MQAESSHRGNDIISRGCLINLSAGAAVKVTPMANWGLSTQGESTFRGFLYSPIQGVAVAWSVHVDYGWSNCPTGWVVQYAITYLNIGPTLPWNPSSYVMTAVVAGTYYIEFCAITYSGNPVNMIMYLNGVTTLSRLWIGWGNSYSWVSRSRAIIVYLNANDQLQVRMGSMTNFVGNMQQGTSFMGMLLYHH